MELQIHRDVENPLMKRRELTFTLSFTGEVPSREKVREVLAEKLKAEPERIVIFTIQPSFGKQEASVEAAVYMHEETQAFLTPSYLAKRGVKQEESS